MSRLRIKLSGWLQIIKYISFRRTSELRHLISVIVRNKHLQMSLISTIIYFTVDETVLILVL